MDLVGEDRIELSPRVPRTRMLALHHTPEPISDCEFRIADLKTRVSAMLGFCPIPDPTNSEIRNPKSEILELVRQVRLELTIPCLRGRCLDPIWLLTQIVPEARASARASISITPSLTVGLLTLNWRN